MSTTAPKFLNSPYFVPEDGNWHLKDGAPAEIVAEFNEFMDDYDDNENEGIDM